jgi:hypothetical protein
MKKFAGKEADASVVRDLGEKSDAKNCGDS